jgi:hypothetical protein
MVVVEAVQLPVADAAGRGRDVVDVGLGDHRRHRGVDVARAELVRAVLVPQPGKVVVRADRRLKVAMLRSCASSADGRW